MTVIANQPLSMSTLSQSQTQLVVAGQAPIENGKNREWSQARAWLEDRVAMVLDSSGKFSLKERAQAYSDASTWLVAGPKSGRDAQALSEIEILGSKLGSSDMNGRLHAIGNMQALTMSVAYSEGKNGITAGIEFMKNLSAADRELYFTAAIIPDKIGQYAYKSEGEFYSYMARLEGEHNAYMTRVSSENGGKASTRDEVASSARLEAAQAQNKTELVRLKGQFSSVLGGAKSVTDTIELSGPGAKAAAKTLQTDGANDVALKALETLKQVGEQQREWAKSLAEEDATRPLDELSDGKATPVAANIAKPGSVLSIAA